MDLGRKLVKPRDLVIDVAEAMNTDALLKETFVVEGHASAEGDYAQNLLLSQERAERISRELVRHGVSAERLMPVGYGETEAAHPANAGESVSRQPYTEEVYITLTSCVR